MLRERFGLSDDDAGYVGFDPARGDRGHSDTFEEFYARWRTPERKRATFDVVVSADALYHIALERRQLFDAMSTLLCDGGRVAFTDLVAIEPSGQASVGRSFARRLMSRAFQAPNLAAHVESLAHYEALLTATGFCDVHVDDVTDQTLGAFVRFLDKRLDRYKHALAPALVRRYRLFAALVRFALRNKWFVYVKASGIKKVKSH